MSQTPAADDPIDIATSDSFPAGYWSFAMRTSVSTSPRSLGSLLLLEPYCYGGPKSAARWVCWS